MDFDIANYNLEELLALFELSYDFNEVELKKARNIALMLHPDKSGLDKEYFLFFRRAYGMIEQVYKFRRKTQRDITKDTRYTVEIDEEREHLLEQVKKKKNFHKWFNDMFEKSEWHKQSTARGHGDWLKSDDDIDTRKTTMADMAQAFERKKGEVRDIVVRHDIEEVSLSGGYLLDDTESDSFENGDPFAKMRYDDVRQAHTNTVVPVTHDDFVNRKQYGNVGQLQTARAQQDVVPLSEQQARRMLENKERMQNGVGARRAYNLLKEEERSKQSAEVWWASLKQIGNA